MPNSKKGTNFKEFAATLRYPPLQFDNPSKSDPLQTPGGQFLTNFASNVVNDIITDIQENGLEFYANKYNKKPFKNYKQKLKEDEELRKPVNKALKAALVNQANLESGDPFAFALNSLIDSMTENITLDSNGVFAKNDTGARARKLLLSSFGVNSLQLLGFLALSVTARAIPIEFLTELNVKEYLKYLNPVFLIEKMISAVKDKQVSQAINDFKLLGRFVNGVLTSTQFEPRIQQAFVDYLAEQPNLPPALKNVSRFDEITGFLDPEAINENSDADTIRTLSTVSFDLLQNGKLGFDLNLISRDINGEVLGKISINNLSSDLTNLVTGAQDDLQSLFDDFASCELPDPTMFEKYRELDKARKEFFKGFKRAKKKDQKKKKPKIKDRYEMLENLLASAATSLFYVATATLFKIAISYLQKLVPDLSCAQLSLMILPEEELGPKKQNDPVNPEDIARTIAENLKRDNPFTLSESDLEDISALLTEIATSVGLFNGVDINTLNEFLSLTMSVLTQREFCELISGQPNFDTINIVQNIIDIKYPNAGISKEYEDIVRFFSCISSLVDPGCNRILSEADIPTNAMLCSSPAYYETYNDLRIALLKQKGLDDAVIETQINLVCDLNAQQAQQFLDLINSGDPIDQMLPTIQTGAPNCGINNTIDPINEIVQKELVQTYSELFATLKTSLDLNMVGDRGFLSKILSGKNGLPYPSYLKVNELLDSSYQYNKFLENLTSIQNPEEAQDKLEKQEVSVYEPKLVGSWMRLNQEEFCNLSYKDRLTSTPLNISPEGFDNYLDFRSDRFVLTDEDRSSLEYIFSLTEEDMKSLDNQKRLKYEDLFSRLGNIKFGVRGISFSGMYDLSQSSIIGLSVDGVRQTNLKSGVYFLPDFKQRIAMLRAQAMINPAILPFISANIADIAKTLKNTVTEPLPGVSKPITSELPAYRVKSYNFFILPSTKVESPVGEIKTKILDYYPSNLSQLIKKDPDNTDSSVDQTTTPEYTEYAQLVSFPEQEFDKVSKSFEMTEIVKKQDDYFVNLNESSISTPNLEAVWTTNREQNISKQSLVFAEIVLDAIKNNANIQMDEIPRNEKYVEYLSKDLYNYTFNVFLDAMMKIPAMNGKNLKYGITDEQVNVLNSRHVNTVTGELDPVLNPEDYGGTEFDPSYYIYKKLSDDWKNLYNVYLRERSEEFTPIRTSIPDFQYFAEKASDLYLKLSEETREADDLSNQAPFDLITTKSSLVTMNSLFDMMIKIFCFEHYYKGFSFLNSVEPTDNVFDNVYFDFLAKRFKKYAIETGAGNSKRRSKSSKFYHMLMEIYVMILLKKKEAKMIALTPTIEETLRKIGRKTNIWKFGIPKSNLTQKEAAYFEASMRIAAYEVPGYPMGTFSNAIVATEGSLSSANKIFAEAKKQREQQIRLRNTYWNLIMEDCEESFEVLLRTRIREEMAIISKELSILNPNLVKENSILNMPVNGGPFVQSGENISKDDTAHMRNVYTHHPATLYSAGNALIADSAYRSFYGTKEDNNDRNFNGFMFSRLYDTQKFKAGVVTLKSQPKEPVYSYSINYNGGIDNEIYKSFSQQINPLISFDSYRYSPDFLVPSLLNYIELNKRDIIVNSFLLNAVSSKAKEDIRWNDLFVFASGYEEAKTRAETLDTMVSEAGQYDLYIPAEQRGDNAAAENQYQFSDTALRGTEKIYTSLKRYRIYKTEGSLIRKLGSDAFAVGGASASNMPIVLSQPASPFILEQYINLVEIGNDFFPGSEQDRYRYIDPNTGFDIYSDTLTKLQETLYDVNNTYDSRKLSGFRAVEKEIFLGPVSLSAFIYWLGSSGFFTRGGQIDSGPGGELVSFLEMPISWFFKPGTFKYGVRMLLLQPDSDLTISEGSHTYFQQTLFPEEEGNLNTETNLRDRIRTLKAFNKENGYAIPLFKAEEEVDWTFRQLKAIYDSYIATDIQVSSDEMKEPAKWIDHTSLTRPINTRLFNEIICSEQYKKMFDFCIPLRYFASLSAIYTTKAFTNSIGSSIDWGGEKRVIENIVSKRETNVLMPFYQTLRKVFYHSYNSFDTYYNGEDDDNENVLTEQERKELFNRPATNIDKDGIVRISDIQSDIMKANQVDPLIKEGLGSLRDIIGSGFEGAIVPDPTNACGAARNTESCD